MMSSSHAALLKPDDDVASVLSFDGPDDGADDPFGSEPDLLAERETNASQGHYVKVSLQHHVSWNVAPFWLA